MSGEAAVWIDTKDLVPWDRNPRHNDEAAEALAAFLRRKAEASGRPIETYFGSPLVAQASSSRVIAGHTRLKAAIKIGLTRLPVRFLDVDDDEAQDLALADNKLGEIAEWDTSALEALVRDDHLDLSALGWSEQEMAALTPMDDLETLEETSTDRKGQGVESGFSQMDSAKNELVTIAGKHISVPKETTDRLVAWLDMKYQAGTGYREAFVALVESAT